LKIKRKISKDSKFKNKRQEMGYETMASMTRCSSPSTKAPTGKTYISLLLLHPIPKHLPHATSYT
jgi:hypothetical protein